MSNIKILPEQLANQIAAGEVVERPASVVKELVENAIDAGARHISIQVEGNGTQLMRVMDDGKGMDQDDILLCLERHATSKLYDAAQLAAILTLGFRGEAIPSIASVSRLTITARLHNQTLGNRAEVRYGIIKKIHQIGCRQGTVMEVRDLFANMPARKKFLKTTRTELAHIDEAIKAYCLARPTIGFTYILNDQTLIRMKSDDTLEARVRKLLAPRLQGRLIQVGSDADGAGGDESGTIVVRGYLLPPDESVGSNAKLRVFVNNRAVKDRTIAHGVLEGMRNFLMQGRSPAGAIFVSLPPTDVDVNVHPAKQEIRFRHQNQVHTRVAATVSQAMQTVQENLKFTLFGRPTADADPGYDPTVMALDDRETDCAPQTPPLPWPQPTDQPPPISRTAEQPVEYASQHNTPNQAAVGVSNKSTSSAVTGHHQTTDGLQTTTPASPLTAVVASSLRPIGQLFDLYILCELRNDTDTRLVVIDQHAAHERILFETLKQQHRASQVASQALLFPRMIEPRPRQHEQIDRHGPELTRLGFQVDPFGDNSFVIKAVPAVLAHLNPEDLLMDVLDQLGHPEAADVPNANGSHRIDALLATMACKSAIKAGRSMEPDEIRELLEQMRQSRAFSHCPHGRPVVKSFDVADIKKWFHRT